MGKEFHPNTLAELFLWPGTAAEPVYAYIRPAFEEHIRRKDGCRGPNRLDETSKSCPRACVTHRLGDDGLPQPTAELQKASHRALIRMIPLRAQDSCGKGVSQTGRRSSVTAAAHACALRLAPEPLPGSARVGTLS